LPTTDRARPAHRRDLTLIRLGHEFGELRRAEGGAQTLGEREILDPDRQAVQQPERLPRHDRTFCAARLRLRPLPAGGDERVHGAIDAFGARAARREQLDRRDLLGADQGAQLARAQIAQLGHAKMPPRLHPRPCRATPPACSSG
jgi:hypothetical protein